MQVRINPRIPHASVDDHMRGFLGPIGDDLPSIFPIVFGILIFMGTMMYAFNELSARDNYLEIRKATLSLSQVVMQRGYLSDAGFTNACESEYKTLARRQSVRVLITVKKFCPTSPPIHGRGAVDLTQDVFSVTRDSAPYAQRDLQCSSENKDPNYYADRGKPDFPKDFVILTYPVAVDCMQEPGAVKGIGMVNIIGWRK